MKIALKTRIHRDAFTYCHWPYQYYRTRRWRKFQKWKTYRRGELVWRKMAERTHWWIERWLSVSPFLSLFLSFSLCLSFATIYRATFLAIYLSTCLFMYLSIDLFIHLSIKLSIFLSIQPFIHPLTSLCYFFFSPSLHRSMSTAIHHHVLRSVSLSIHPCICPSTSSSSYPSIYLATHAFIWSSTLLAIFRSVSVCRSIYLSIDRSVSLSSHPSFDLSLGVFMDLAMHRSVYVSIDLFTRLSIDLAIKSHCTYPLLCFKNW